MRISSITCILFLLLSTAFFSPLSAQVFKVKWGDNAKMKFDFDDAVPLSGGRYMILKMKEKRTMGFFGGGSVTYEPSVLLVSADMEQIDEKPVPIEEKNTVFKGFEKYGNNIFLLYTAYDKESKTTSFYALKIDEKLNLVSKSTLGKFESDNRGDQAKPNYRLSSDSSKVLLLVEGPERRKESEQYYIGVFDTNLKTLWSRQVSLPIEQRYIDIYDMDVTNDGKVFVALKHYEKEIKRESVREDGTKVPSYVYKMLVYADATSKEKELKFNLNNQFIHGTKIINAPDGSITVAGLYKKKANGNITGAFYAKVEKNSDEVKNPKMVELPIDLIKLVDKDNYASAKDKDPGLYPNFLIRNILVRSNGSVDLISEYYKLVIRTYTDSRGHTTTTYNYYYGDIVNTNIDKDGKAVFTRVPKNQKMTNADLFMGIYSFVMNDKLVILFDDDEDNIDRDLAKKPDDVMNFKKSVFAAATIDAKGNLSRQAIYSHRDETYVTVPRLTSRISNTQFLIVSDLLKLFKKRTRFGVLDYK